MFLGRVGNLITWDDLVTFLGRDGHRLTNLANLKYWGDAFCNYWEGWGPIIGGDIYPPSPPRFGTAAGMVLLTANVGMSSAVKICKV